MAIKNGSISQAVVRSPILWGGLATAGFYGLIHAGILSGRLLERYFASHPVEYLATGMFFVGLAALVIRAADVAQQYAAIGRALLGPATPSQGIVGDCEVLLDRLDRLPASRRNDYLVRRLREAIEHVRRRGSADQLEEELRYLADLDADRAAAGFALVRIIIWAIPILGFLGTVIGITLAIANLSPQALEDSLPQVTAGLGVAFDTTALALGLSIVLMFAQFLTDRAQQALLNRVDQRAAEELRGRFVAVPKTAEGQLAAIQQTAQRLLSAIQQLVEQQGQVWRAGLQEAGAQWNQATETAAAKFQSGLEAALDKSLQRYAQHLSEAERQAAEQVRRHWDKVQQTQVQNTHALASLQAALTRQTELLQQALEAVGQVTRLETALNRNLAALAGSKNFEQTVMSLAAAIHLLNARLAEMPAGQSVVRLEDDSPSTHAA